MGERRQMNVRLPRGLIERIDAARGRMVSRDVWIERAAELALRPVAAIADPELRQAVHEHVPSRPLRTEFRGTIKVRIWLCECGAEVVQ